MFTAPQNVFPRSYQYDLDCVKYRRTRACDALKEKDGKVSLFIFIVTFRLVARLPTIGVTAMK